MKSRGSGFGSAPCLVGGDMNLLKLLKQLARRRGAARINADRSISHGERAVIVRWGNTATLKREPLLRRERREDE